MTAIDHNDVLEILRLLDASPYDELHLHIGDLQLHVIKNRQQGEALQEPDPVPEAARRATLPAQPSPAASAPQPEQHAAAVAPESPVEPGLLPIKAPMLGTFYRSPKPEAPPFIEVGQLVTEEDVVCLIEVMKLFSTVTAGVRGRIKKICVDNAQLVEYQQTLFLVAPEAAPDHGEGGAQ